MNQANLFSDEQYRKSDAVSSKIRSDTEVKTKKRVKNNLVVFFALSQHEGSTSKELAHYMLWDRHKVAKCLPSLRKANWVKQGPLRYCQLSKQKCLTWFTTEHGRAEYKTESQIL